MCLLFVVGVSSLLCLCLLFYIMCDVYTFFLSHSSFSLLLPHLFTSIIYIYMNAPVYAYLPTSHTPVYSEQTNRSDGMGI